MHECYSVMPLCVCVCETHPAVGMTKRAPDAVVTIQIDILKIHCFVFLESGLKI